MLSILAEVLGKVNIYEKELQRVKTLGEVKVLREEGVLGK